MRAVLGLLTAASLVLAALPTHASGVALLDIQGHWARPQIEAGVASGYLSGYPDGSFRPNAPVTRAEFFKILGAAMRLTPSRVRTGFAEESMAQTHWAFAQGHIPAAVSAGLINPPDYGPAFQGDQPVTRREIVMATVRALGMAEQTRQHLPLNTPDAGAYEPWLRSYAAIALHEGIITGYEDKRLGLERSATRAEALVMVQRVLAKLTPGAAAAEAPAGDVRHPGEGEPFWSVLSGGRLARSAKGQVETIALPKGGVDVRLLPAPAGAVWVRYVDGDDGVLARYVLGQWSEVARFEGVTPEMLVVDDDGRLWFTNGGVGLMAADKNGRVWRISGTTEPIRFGAIDWDGQFWGFGGGTLLRVSTEGSVTAFTTDLPEGTKVEHFTLGEDGTAWLLAKPRAGSGAKAEGFQLREGRVIRQLPLLGPYYGGLGAEGSLRIVSQSGPFLWVAGETGGKADGLFRLDMTKGAFARLVLPGQVGLGQVPLAEPGGGVLVRDGAGRFWRVLP